MRKPQLAVIASLATFAVMSAVPVILSGQQELGPKVEKTYGQGLPRDSGTLIFSDDQYPVWPLTPAQKEYASIDGARMKRHVVNLAQIALRYRDEGHKWWGRLPGTSADREGMAYMTREFESLGLKVEHFPYTLPEDWRPTDFSASYLTAGGKTIQLATVFPVADTKPIGPQGITAEAVWVGVGAGADFLGRDVKGKASSSTARSCPEGGATRPVIAPACSTRMRAP